MAAICMFLFLSVDQRAEMILHFDQQIRTAEKKNGYDEFIFRIRSNEVPPTAFEVALHY